MSRNTVAWSAKHRYPYIMLATELEPTRQSFLYYDQCAVEHGYEAGSQHHGYLFKVHVDETEELAEQAGRRYVEGPSNPFLEGNQGNVKNFIQNLPGLTSRTQLLPTVNTFAAAARGRDRINADGSVKPADINGSYEQQIEKMSIISGTPKTVIPKIRTVLETLRPGTIFFWDGDGAMDHNDAMRSLRLMGEEVIPACREMAKELDLPGPFDIDPATNKKLDPKPAEPSVKTGG
jgi:alkanesulfonate monooxygenase SsuD/methylene tetrahydromethanopterin reductase-like flavin-dependent oxidoreductase (luciferase family)